MADDGKGKTTEQSEDIGLPTIEVSEEGAAGGTEDSDGRKRGSFRTLLNKVITTVQGRRSRSKSPEIRTAGESSNPVPHRSPSKKSAGKLKSFCKSLGRKDDESESLCAQQFTDDSKTQLAPPEKDIGFSSITPPDPKPEPCPGYGFDACENSSVSSAPSQSSSLPDDDDSGVVFTSDFNSSEDNKQK